MKFGVRLQDTKTLATCLKDLQLISLNLQGNFFDDELTNWLVAGLIANQTIVSLNLANNKITSEGAIKLCSLAMRSNVLNELILSFNSVNL